MVRVNLNGQSTSLLCTSQTSHISTSSSTSGSETSGHFWFHFWSTLLVVLESLHQRSRHCWVRWKVGTCVAACIKFSVMSYFNFVFLKRIQENFSYSWESHWVKQVILPSSWCQGFASQNFQCECGNCQHLLHSWSQRRSLLQQAV